MKRSLGNVTAGVLCLIGATVMACEVFAAAPDLILRNSAVITIDPDRPEAEAIAIAGERIVAVGSNREIDALADNGTKVIDLDGRTVIPGLIDTHIHAIRGGQTFRFETYWYDAGNIGDAMNALKSAAEKRPADQWVAVVGSWHPHQFAEKRPPTVAELTQAVPDTARIRSISL